jgi:ubiquinone/menaquinone biosynthesis C-methylase UbiE/ADP-ribose pyrophosphatase YjhB (NUDIX family)
MANDTDPIVCFDRDDRRFNLRVAAVIRRGRQVLLHRALADDFWTLPGGRPMLGEDSTSALVRELREELDVEAVVERLLWTVESFFDYEDRRHHQVALYFLAQLPVDCPLANGPSAFAGREPHLPLEFRWFDPEELPGIKVYPTFLASNLDDLPDHPVHLIDGQFAAPPIENPKSKIENAPAASIEHNRRAWDALVRQRQGFTRPARDEDFDNPFAKIGSADWLGGGVRGRQVLCLASGGGRQSALFAAAGAKVTVVDISPAMLALDRQVAAERGFDIRAVEASMDDLSALAEASFDIVSQPVSTCYVPDVAAVFREVARVLVDGGLYVSQHKQPGSLQADVRPAGRGYELIEPYYRQGPLPPVVGSKHREPGTLEYLHRWEQLVGGMCRAGFVIEDLAEPLHADEVAAPGAFKHRGRYVPPYVRIKARRLPRGGATGGGVPRLWTP